MPDKTALSALEWTKIALFKSSGVGLIGLSEAIVRRGMEPDAFIKDTFGELLLRHSFLSNSWVVAAIMGVTSLFIFMSGLRTFKHGRQMQAALLTRGVLADDRPLFCISVPFAVTLLWASSRRLGVFHLERRKRNWPKL